MYETRDVTADFVLQKHQDASCYKETKNKRITRNSSLFSYQICYKYDRYDDF